MGKVKASRKGKKAWRKNISTADHDEYLQNVAKDARSGGPLESVPSEALFFVDKDKDEAVQRKVDRHRGKALRTDSILTRGSLVKPVAWPAKRKNLPSGSEAALPLAAKVKTSGKGEPAAATAKPEAAHNEKKRKGGVRDAWAEEEEVPENVLDTRPPKVGKKLRLRSKVRPQERLSAHTPALQIDEPGCSYNPSYDDHQEALGQAVAQVVQKELAKDLRPEPVIRQMYFLEAAGVAGEEHGEGDKEDEDEDSDDAGDREGQENGGDIAAEGDGGQAAAPSIARQAQEKEMAEKKEVKRQRKDIERLPDILEELEGEREQTASKRQRKDVARQEKAAAGPPRLGRHKFDAAPVQVLLSEELTGSLRQLKGCCTLARDRFKSLQRRGLLEPRVPVKRKQARSLKLVEQGSQGKKEREMHAEIQAMRTARKEKASGVAPTDILL
eukprot:jgi/Mesen1/4175/ME000219S03300